MAAIVAAIMHEKAHVHSLAALQDFRGALASYVAESKKGVIGLEVEIRRAYDYIAVDRAQFWRSEIRRAMEAVARARDDLHNARTFKGMDGYTPSCIDEQKALQRAQDRLKLAEQKAEAVKKWTRAVQHELNEYIGRMSQFAALLDGDLPKAMASMDRILAALDTYFSTIAPRAMSQSHIDRAEECRSMANPSDRIPTDSDPADSAEKPIAPDENSDPVVSETSTLEVAAPHVSEAPS